MESKSNDISRYGKSDAESQDKRFIAKSTLFTRDLSTRALMGTHQIDLSTTLRVKHLEVH